MSTETPRTEKQHWAEAVAECITDEQEALRLVGFYEDGEWQPAMLAIGRENLALKRDLTAAREVADAATKGVYSETMLKAAEVIGTVRALRIQLATAESDLTAAREQIAALTADRDSWAEQDSQHVGELVEAMKRVAELEAGLRNVLEWESHRMGAVSAGTLRALLAPSPETKPSALTDVAAERRRQQQREGWTPEHDDEHTAGDLAMAGAAYAYHAAQCDRIDHHHCMPVEWPWADSWWKPKDRRRDLVRAAALLVAEIERIDRAPAPETKP